MGIVLHFEGLTARRYFEPVIDERDLPYDAELAYRRDVPWRLRARYKMNQRTIHEHWPPRVGEVLHDDLGDILKTGDQSREVPFREPGSPGINPLCSSVFSCRLVIRQIPTLPSYYFTDLVIYTPRPLAPPGLLNGTRL